MADKKHWNDAYAELRQNILREEARRTNEALDRNIAALQRHDKKRSPSDALRKEHSISISCGESLDMVTEWSECGFPQAIVDKIPFRDMRPVQMQVIPYILAEKSICVLSETGSGKTLSFVLPYAAVLRQDAVLLVIAPTRELASQIHNEFHRYLACSVLVVGGAMFEKQRVLLQTAQVIVCTIGSISEHMSFRTIDFARVKYLVVDEMDKMLDDGFEDDLMRIWRNMSLKATQLFSATRSPRIGKIGVRTLIAVGRTNRINPKVGLVFLQPDSKPEMLSTLLSEYRVKDRMMMVFCNEIKTCELLEKKFPNLTILHGKKSAEYRNKTMESIRSGNVRYLVCTDVAGRGIDIQNVDVVINYEFPKSIETFIHRAGRTGRNIVGACVSFLTKDDAPMYKEIELLAAERSIDLPDFMVEKKEYVLD